jgi:4-diphosphocytidyl-2-C-methyl-D-erythritol kinase
MPAVTIRAFAKINLSLRIKELPDRPDHANARADGFHEVQTILQAIDLSDRVRCEARRGPFHLVCSMPGVPTDRTNLVWQAAQRLWDAAGRKGQPRDAVVTLDKKIPMKAGLGGGSSDAAAALLGLRRVWKLRVADEELHAIGARLGSDVPYFFVGGTALGLGRGEEVYPLDDLPRLWVVLIVPPFGIATADAYEWLDDLRARTLIPVAPRYLPGTWLGRIIPLVNDLEPPVIERHPVIGKLKDRLAKLGAVMVAMSGSGSTVFGIFTTARAAESAARTFTRSGADVLCARFLPRS